MYGMTTLSLEDIPAQVRDRQHGVQPQHSPCPRRDFLGLGLMGDVDGIVDLL